MFERFAIDVLLETDLNFENRVTNAVTEGINGKIQRGLHTATATNFITAIYLHCGGLKLHPGTPDAP